MTFSDRFSEFYCCVVTGELSAAEGEERSDGNYHQTGARKTQSATLERPSSHQSLTTNTASTFHS